MGVAADAGVIQVEIGGPNDGTDRRRTWCVLAVAALLLAAMAPPMRADSIWEKRQASSAFLYSEYPVPGGDSLTVLVSETSSFKQEADRTMEKDTSEHGGPASRRPW